jgi:putative ABC transport system permease protein
MMNRMIVGNLVHRPIRSLISVVAVGLEVTLILLIVGLSLGMVSDTRQRQAGIGADVVVMPPGSSYIVGLTGAPMPIKIGNVLAKLPHVVAVAPVITQVSTNGTLEVIAGIDLKSYEALGPFHFLEGGPFQSADDVLIDDILAKAKHIKLGDKMEILSHEFRLAGIVAPGKGAKVPRNRRPAGSEWLQGQSLRLLPEAR